LPASQASGEHDVTEFAKYWVQTTGIEASFVPYKLVPELISAFACGHETSSSPRDFVRQ